MGRTDRPNEEVGQSRVARALLVISLGVAWLLCSGFGPERPSSMGASPLGRADATVASGIHIESLASNPACIKRGKGQAFELGYMRNPLASSNNFYLASADNSSPLGLAGGASLAYEAGKFETGTEFTATDSRVVLAAGAKSDVATIMIGASARRMGLTLKRSGEDATEISGWTGDVGLAIDLAGGLMIGVAARNLLEIDDIAATRRLAGALAYGNKHLVLEAGGSWALSGDNPIYRVGALVPIADVAALRAGYINDSFTDPSTRQSVTFGGSVIVGRARIDVGAEMNIDKPSELRIGGSLVYFLPFSM